MRARLRVLDKHGRSPIISAQAFTKPPQETVTYRSRLAFALAMAALAAILLPSFLPAQVTVKRTHGSGVIEEGRNGGASHGLASEAGHEAARQRVPQSYVPTDSMVLHPEQQTYATGTIMYEYQPYPPYNYWTKGSGAMSYGTWEDGFHEGYCRFDLSPVPPGSMVRSAVYRYFQNEAIASRTHLSVNTMDPYSTEPESLHHAKATTPAEISTDTGWVSRGMDSVGLNAIQRGVGRAGILTVLICGDYTPLPGSADGYDGTNPPALVVTCSPLQRDASVRTVLSPGPTVGTDETILPRAVVANFGTEAVEIPVRLRVDSTSYLSDTSAFVGAGEIETLGFRPWHPLGPGTWSLRCSTMLAYDSLPWDDVISSQTVAKTAHDCSVTGIVAPSGVVDSGVSVVPSARIKNRGIRPDTCAVVFTIGDDYSDTSSTFLAPGATQTVDFESWTPASVGWQVVSCSAALAGDEIRTNDCRHGTVQVLPSSVRETAMVYPHNAAGWSGYVKYLVSTDSFCKYGPPIYLYGIPDTLRTSGWAKFDLTGIPASSTIAEASLFYDVPSTNSQGTRRFVAWQLQVDPETASAERIDGGHGWCVSDTALIQSTGWYSVPLNDSGRAAIERSLEQGWLALGMNNPGSARSLYVVSGQSPNEPYLRVIYVPFPGIEAEDTARVEYAEPARVCPNPARLSTQLRISPGARELVRADIVDCAGRQVRVYECADPLRVNQVTLNLRGLSPGVYLVRLKVGSLSSTQKLVVQH